MTLTQHIAAECEGQGQPFRRRNEPFAAYLQSHPPPHGFHQDLRRAMLPMADAAAAEARLTAEAAMTPEADSLWLRTYGCVHLAPSHAVIRLQCRRPSRTLAGRERREAGQQLGRRLPLATYSSPMACRRTIGEAQQT